MATIFQRIGKAFRLATPVEDATQTKQISVHVEPMGSSGTEIYGGYYSEEYLQTLQGPRVADIWDKMRRSDPKIKMILSAVKNPIRSAQWSVQPGGTDQEVYQLHTDLIEQILFKDLSQPWTQQLSEILTYLEFGFSTFEVIHKVVTDHPKFGHYNSLSKLAFRSQKTIERWNLDPKTEEILSISQYAYGDLQKLVEIPGPFLLVFTNEKEGANYEGISMLRPCYGPWSRKNLFLKLMSVGVEKFAVPTPFMEVPEGKETGKQFNNAKDVLKKFVSHQQQYILYPAGWKLDFTQSNFDASKIRPVINEENVEMTQAFLANFLELGQSGSGSYALSNDLSDFFLTGIESVANHVCEVINQHLIPNLIKMNFGPQSVYPQLTCAGIKDKPGKEFAEILKLLFDGSLLTPDEDLEKDLRKKYKLPKKMESVAATPQPLTPPTLGPAAAPLSIQYSEPGVVYISKILVSKKVALTQEEAKTLAGQITTIEPQSLVEESESHYSIQIVDSSKLEEGSLKSFEAVEGITVYYGKAKSLTP